MDRERNKVAEKAFVQQYRACRDRSGTLLDRELLRAARNSAIMKGVSWMNGACSVVYLAGARCGDRGPFVSFNALCAVTH